MTEGSSELRISEVFVLDVRCDCILIFNLACTTFCKSVGFVVNVIYAYMFFLFCLDVEMRYLI
jgi:hypothetical protein